MASFAGPSSWTATAWSSSTGTRDPAITVEPRRPDIPVSKESVVSTGLSGRPYPPKTSRHVLPELPGRPTPLETLRG
jgi:hypothetical protein